jgi:hypothetical protein
MPLLGRAFFTCGTLLINSAKHLVDLLGIEPK